MIVLLTTNPGHVHPPLCVLRKRTDFVVDATLQVAHVNPALLLLHLRVVVQNLVSQPRQVIHSQLVLFTCGRRRSMERKWWESYNQFRKKKQVAFTAIKSQIIHWGLHVIAVTVADDNYVFVFLSILKDE